MMTMGEAICRTVESYHALGGRWVPIAAVALRAGIEPELMRAVVLELFEGDDFQAEPQPFGHRISEADRAYAVEIGGEARHLIRWGA